MISFTNPFTLKGISQGLGYLYQRQEKLYLAQAAVITALGYAMLALFPLMTLLALFKSIVGISSATGFMAWLGAVVWILLTVFAGSVTIAMLLVKTQMPSGLGLKQDKAPRLHELLHDISQSYESPKIDRIIIHDHYALNIVNVPRFGLPFFSVKVLHIGLPVLQTLNPPQFKGALARKLGQYSAAHNKLTHWMYQWRQYAQQYKQAYRKAPQAFYWPLYRLFQFYTPLLNACTVHAARHDELEADVYGLQTMNDSELADVIIRYSVCKVFVEQKYWPSMTYRLQQNPEKKTYLPHMNMPATLRKSLTESTFAQILKDLLNTDPAWHDIQPSLHSRLEHLGQTKLNMPPPTMETAAQRYLGEAFSAVVKLLDKQWLTKKVNVYKKPPVAQTTDKPQTASAPPTKPPVEAHSTNTPSQPVQVKKTTLCVREKQYQALRSKARQTTLNQHEVWQLASLAEEFDGKAAAIVLYQQILRQDPQHAKTLFAVGRILLSQNDPSGIKILERAMSIDKGCVAQSCWMLAQYFKRTGDENQSKIYLERAANVSAAA